MESDLPHDPQPTHRPPWSLSRAMSNWLDAQPSPYDGLLFLPLLVPAIIWLDPAGWVVDLGKIGVALVLGVGADLASRRIRLRLPVRIRWVARMSSVQLLTAACICQIPWLLQLGAAQFIPTLNMSCGAHCDLSTSIVLGVSGLGELFAILGAALLPFQLAWRGIRYTLAPHRRLRQNRQLHPTD